MSEVALPASLEEVYAIRKREPGAAVLAGGTDLLVRMRADGKKPPVLIGLERIPGLSGIAIQDGVVRIGPMVTHQNLLDSPVIRKHLAVMHEAAQVLGSPPVRHMGTIGGNICTASPAGDLLPALYVLDAEVEISSPAKKRVVPIATFITGPGRTILTGQEILTGIRIPIPDPGYQGFYRKVGQRRALAISIVSMAALLMVSPDKTVRSARFAWGSVGPVVMRFPDVESSFAGRTFGPALLADVGRQYSERIQPISDIRASASYRKMVAAGLPLKILEQ